MVMELKTIMRNMVEPVQLLYVLMFSVSLIHMDKIYVDKVCQVNLKSWIEKQNLTIEVCQNITSDESLSRIQNRTQEIVSELKTWEGIMMTAPAILFSLFAGAYSDLKGRKMLLSVPFLGNIFSYLAMFVNLIWWEELRAEYLLISGLAGLSGGYVCFNIGVYSYTADVSKEDRRTMRMSLLNGIFSLGFVIGIQTGSAISDYWTVFMLSTIFGVIGLLYSLVIIQEKEKKIDISKNAQVLGCSPIRDSFRTAFGKRSGGRRMLLLVFLASFMSLMMCLNTGDYDYLMTRLKFGWTAKDWGNYLTVQRVTRVVSLLLLLPLLSSILRISDTVIIISGLVITALSYTVMCLAQTASLMYLAALLQMNSVTTVSIRSQLSKLVDPGESGKIFSVVGIGQSVMALVSHSTFGAVYRLSLDSWPSAYLTLVIGSLSLAALSVIITKTINKRRYETTERGLVADHSSDNSQS